MAKIKTEKKRRLSVYLQTDTIRRVEIFAAKNERSSNWSFERLVTEALGREGIK